MLCVPRTCTHFCVLPLIALAIVLIRTKGKCSCRRRPFLVLSQHSYTYPCTPPYCPRNPPYSRLYIAFSSTQALASASPALSHLPPYPSYHPPPIPPSSLYHHHHPSSIDLFRLLHFWHGRCLYPGSREVSLPYSMLTNRFLRHFVSAHRNTCLFLVLRCTANVHFATLSFMVAGRLACVPPYPHSETRFPLRKYIEVGKTLLLGERSPP